MITKASKNWIYCNFSLWELKVQNCDTVRVKTQTCHEGNGSPCLLYSDLCDRRQVDVCVVWHDNPTEQNGHDTRQVQSLRQAVGSIGKHQHHAKLQRRCLTQVYKLQQVKAAVKQNIFGNIIQSYSHLLSMH